MRASAARTGLAGCIGVSLMLVFSPAHAQDGTGPTVADATSAEASAPSEASETMSAKDRDRLAQSKKHKWLADKGARQASHDATVDAAAREAFEKELEARIGAEPTPVINIFNTWTHETIVVTTDKKKHRPGASRARRRIVKAKDAVDKVGSWHLRCHFTNQPTAMDARLFQVLIEAAHHFGVGRVEIISGFRAPKYNLTLRKKGRQVARRSHHTLGEAVDFRLPGINTPKLRNWARGLKLGGVGYYPSSGFVHVDVGKIRTWRGN